MFQKAGRYDDAQKTFRADWSADLEDAIDASEAARGYYSEWARAERGTRGPDAVDRAHGCAFVWLAGVALSDLPRNVPLTFRDHNIILSDLSGTLNYLAGKGPNDVFGSAARGVALIGLLAPDDMARRALTKADQQAAAHGAKAPKDAGEALAWFERALAAAHAQLGTAKCAEINKPGALTFKALSALWAPAGKKRP